MAVTIDMVLSVRELTIGYADRAVLEGLTFDVPSTGVTAIIGPSGVGKSTLLRTLTRRNDLLPSFWKRGTIELAGEDILADPDPSRAREGIQALAQKSRLYTASVLENLLGSLEEGPMTVQQKRERALAILADFDLLPSFESRLSERAIDLSLGLQRQLSLARIAAAKPKIILVDEPNRDVSEEEGQDIAALLSRLSRRSAVVLVTHDQRLARRLSSWVVFLVAGKAAFVGPANNFFTETASDLIRRFLDLGNCWPENTPPVTPVLNAKAVAAPAGFHWVLPGRLGGMPRPGMLSDEGADVRGLQSLGVKALVTLEETAFQSVLLGELGIEALHLPIPDMEAPEVDKAFALCETIADRIRKQRPPRPVVCHCKGGLGRTGTMLAAYLVYEGQGALRSLEEVRAICPHYVQSENQIEFLHKFALYCRRLRPA